MAVKFCFLIFLTLMRVSEYNTDRGCLPNCYCSASTAECYLVRCHDRLEDRYPTLVVKGHLCRQHFQTLANFLGNIRVILHSATCRTIPNCE